MASKGQIDCSQKSGDVQSDALKPVGAFVVVCRTGSLEVVSDRVTLRPVRLTYPALRRLEDMFHQVSWSVWTQEEPVH